MWDFLRYLIKESVGEERQKKTRHAQHPAGIEPQPLQNEAFALLLRCGFFGLICGLEVIGSYSAMCWFFLLFLPPQ